MITNVPVIYLSTLLQFTTTNNINTFAETTNFNIYIHKITTAILFLFNTKMGNKTTLK